MTHITIILWHPLIGQLEESLKFYGDNCFYWTLTNVCANCGANPCYHLCENSPHYYSPEQEKLDDPTYGDMDRWEGYGDPEIHSDDMVYAESTIDNYPYCSTCGDPIDYCQGHGLIAL